MLSREVRKESGKVDGGKVRMIGRSRTRHIAREIPTQKERTWNYARRYQADPFKRKLGLRVSGPKTREITTQSNWKDGSDCRSQTWTHANGRHEDTCSQAEQVTPAIHTVGQIRVSKRTRASGVRAN